MFSSRYLLCFLLFVCFSANASQEGGLRFSSFVTESDGIGTSGPIKVSGTQNIKGIESLKVNAFGRLYELNAKQLKELQPFGANGLQLTYEHGYKELGGRTIYIILSTGFTSKTVRRKLVSVSESGSIIISTLSP